MNKQELSLKINDEFLDTTSKEILYTLMEEFDNLVTENSSEEIIEKAAEKFYPPKTTDLICSPKLVRDSFIAGAKWQQEQDKNLYSEEDTIEFADFYYQYKELIKLNNWETIEISKKDVFKKWFEKFKKK